MVPSAEGIPPIRGDHAAGRLPIHLHGGPDTIEQDFASTAELWRRAGTQSGVYLPLIRDGKAIGVLGVRRSNPEPYTPAQIDGIFSGNFLRFLRENL